MINFFQFYPIIEKKSITRGGKVIKFIKFLYSENNLKILNCKSKILEFKSLLNFTLPINNDVFSKIVHYSQFNYITFQK